VAEVMQMVREGKIMHPHVVAALFFYDLARR